MAYKQRDVVKIPPTSLPDGQSLKHPFLIISCNDVNTKEKVNYYTGVMMTGSPSSDRYSFPLDASMFEGHLEKAHCQLRLHILVSFHENKIEKLITRMNKKDFIQVLQQIKDTVFAID